MKKTLTVIVVSTIGFTAQAKEWTRQQVCNYLPQVAKEVSTNLPMVLDESTMITNVAAIPSTCTLVYSTDVDVENAIRGTQWGKAAFIEAYRQDTKQWVENNYNTNPTTVLFKKHGVNMKYTYRETNGVFMFEHLVGQNNGN